MTGFHLWNVTGSEESFGVWLRRSRCNSEEEDGRGEEEEESYRTNTVFSWADARNVLRGFVRVSFSLGCVIVHLGLTQLIGNLGPFHHRMLSWFHTERPKFSTAPHCNAGAQARKVPRSNKKSPLKKSDF